MSQAVAVDAVVATAAGAEPQDAKELRFVESLERHLGPHVLAAFDHPDVTEVMVNPDGGVWVDTHSVGMKPLAASVTGLQVRAFLSAVASWLGASLTENATQLQAELPEFRFRGARLQGAIAPAVLQPCYALRKRPSRVYSLDEYVERGALGEIGLQALRLAVAEDYNLVIAGGTGTGKTTFLNAITREKVRQKPRHRFFIIEDTREIQCAAANTVQMKTTKQERMVELLRSALRFRPDFILVGEVRGEEALTMLDANCTGHPGGVCTVHAETPEKALRRLNRLAMQANVPDQTELVADAVQMVVQIERFPEGRRVTQIVLVDGLDDRGRFKVQRIPV